MLLAPQSYRSLVRGFASCRNASFSPARFAKGSELITLHRRSISCTTARARKPYYVTTPIFYVNAAPHVGHMYSLILTDILKRWQQLLGKTAFMGTGTDEHGAKVQRAALKAKIEPKAFCDAGADVFKNLAERSGISNDHFVRTTNEAHKEAVQYAWNVLEEKGLIYLSKHEGWYAVSDEAFYPQSAVHLIVEPSTGRKIMVSMETGKEVEWMSETNYKFRLSAFRQNLLDFYEQRPDFVIPLARMKDVIKHVSDGLEDLSVSRPSARLQWGVTVPTDSSQTIYVWLDALLNYVSARGYPWTPGTETEAGWPADCQVIGKDIVRFHCIYWPAFLMALDLPLPKQILTHAFWTLGREKMAKSTGNVVNPFFALDRFGVDTMRYYLAHDGGISRDADYDNEYIIDRYKKGLQGGLGNLSSRLLRGKGWNVRKAIERGIRGDIGTHDEASAAQEEMLRNTPSKVAAKMEGLDVGNALKQIMDMIYATNAYFQNTIPWDLSKSESKEDKVKLDQILYLSSETLRMSAIMLQPFMPSKSSELADMLGMHVDRRGFEYARLGADDSYGEGKVDLGRGTVGVLFPPLMSRS